MCGWLMLRWSLWTPPPNRRWVSHSKCLGPRRRVFLIWTIITVLYYAFFFGVNIIDKSLPSHLPFLLWSFVFLCCISPLCGCCDDVKCFILMTCSLTHFYSVYTLSLMLLEPHSPSPPPCPPSILLTSDPCSLLPLTLFLSLSLSLSLVCLLFSPDMSGTEGVQLGPG